MGAPLPYTPPWPRHAYGAAGRERAGSASSVSSPNVRRRSSVVKPSKHRHKRDAIGFNLPVLSTYLLDESYHDYRGPCFRVTLGVGLFVAIGGLLVGWLIRKFVCDIVVEATLLKPETNDCFKPPHDNCTSPQTVYFWNITNPGQVLLGQAPALQEVGPFAFTMTTVHYNIEYTDNPGRLRYQTLNFYDPLPEESCAACTLNATIYGPNILFGSVMDEFDWDETKLLLQFVSPTVQQMLSGIGQVLSTMAQTPTLLQLFPGLRAPTEYATVLQWASCGTLGMSVSSLQNAQIDAALPYPPEFCGWARLYAGASRQDAALPLPAAQSFLATLASNTQFATEMTHFPPEALGVVLNVTTSQARLLLGYVEFLALTYGKGTLRGMLGPPLGPASGGPIIRRTVSEWFYGWTDPVVQSIQLGPAPDSPWWTFDARFQFLGRRSSEAAAWLGLAQAIANGTAPAAASARFFSTTVATGVGAISETGNVIADYGGVRTVQHPGGVVPVAGRVPAKAGWGDLAQLPFALQSRPFGWWFGPVDLGPDPQINVGLGRQLPFVWDGAPPGMLKYVPSQRYTLHPYALLPCGGAAPNSSMQMRRHAAESCVYGEYIAGVWNQTLNAHAPLFLSKAHFLDADPAVAASLGAGADAMQPDPNTHDLQIWVSQVMGMPVKLRGSVQTNIGLKPTPLFFPTLWHGAPGPGGFTFFPSTWVTVYHNSNMNEFVNLWRIHDLAVIEPRLIAGAMHLAGAVMAGFSFWWLVAARAGERELASGERVRGASAVGAAVRGFSVAGEGAKGEGEYFVPPPEQQTA